MKAAILLLSLALVIGFSRHGRLVDLNREVRQLEARVVGPGKTAAGAVLRSRATGRKTGLSSELPPDMEAKVRRAFEVNGSPDEKEASWRALVKDFARLDHRAVAELIASFEEGESHPLSAAGGICGYCVDLLARANPSEALRFLELRADMEHRGKVAAEAFRRWGIDRPAQAIRWYDELANRGDTLAAEPVLIERVLQMESRIDPAGALGRLLSKAPEFEPGMVPDLGVLIAMELRTGQEHQAFLEALRRSQEQAPDSVELSDLRGGYIKKLVVLLDSWPFDEAVGLIDGNFRPDEKEQLASRIARSLELAEPEHWADWAARIDNPPNTRHPVTSLIYNWARSDPEAAGTWLDRLPPGDLRERAVESYVNSVSAEDPELALPYALRLPDSRRRTGLLKLIHSTWRKKDPSAAAAFAREQGL